MHEAAVDIYPGVELTVHYGAAPPVTDYPRGTTCAPPSQQDEADGPTAYLKNLGVSVPAAVMTYGGLDVNAEGNHVNEMRGDPAARVAHRPAQSVRASTSAATSVSRVQQVELEARQAGDEPVLPSRLANPSLERRESAIPGAGQGLWTKGDTVGARSGEPVFRKGDIIGVYTGQRRKSASEERREAV